ncbi:hypothetical protein ACW9HJ_01805 [Nocardia gipuzkoensis]
MNLDRQLDAEPTDHDSAVAERLTSPRLRRLLYTAIGLSEDSVDLLTTMTTRLRAAEGMILRDPLEEC